MNLDNKISKLLQAIRMHNIDIKIDTIQFYSERNEKYCNMYKVYVKETVRNKSGQLIQKYKLQNQFISKIELLKYLVNKYKECQGEVHGR